MRNSVKILILVALIVVTIVFTLTTGTFKMSLIDIWALVTGQATSKVELVFYKFRMPRLIITLVCGAALALSGLILQVVSKNPLSDPRIIGVNAGSGFGVVLFIAFVAGSSGVNHLYTLPLMSFVGGLLTVLLVFTLSFVGGKFSSNTFILIGIATALGVTGFVYVFTSMFDDTQMDILNRFFAGNIWGDSWEFVIVTIPYIVIIMVITLFRVREMSMMSLDDDMLETLGMNVTREKIILIVLAALLSSISVSVAGSISFIGLIAPHIARMLFKVDMKIIFVGTLLIGAFLLSFADLIGKTVAEPLIIPVGIVVSLIGGPYFLYLLFRGKTI